MFVREKTARGFSDLSLVFMDTTSVSFYGAGGDSLGAYGHSKDHRPDLKQMILAVVIDGEGQRICTEMLPGNTADATVLLPVVDRLRKRFHIGRVCVVADRGMISAATIAALEERKLEYILGARERSSAIIRRFVLEDEAPLTPLLVERARGETQLFVKEIAQQVGPFDDEAVALAQVGQLLLQHQGEERAEHMTADGGI